MQITLIILFIVAAHCVKSDSLVRSNYKIDSVRLGEHDLRTEIDCEDVSLYFIIRISLLECVCRMNWNNFIQIIGRMC